MKKVNVTILLVVVVVLVGGWVIKSSLKIVNFEIGRYSWCRKKSKRYFKI